MASTSVIPASSTSSQADHLAWIQQFAQSKYNTNITDVKAIFVPGYDAGGGGAYMKSSESTAGFGFWVSAATKGLGQARASETQGVEKGKVIFVKELPAKAKTAEVVEVMWIMWHEMGHAVGDRKQPKNISEPYAYRFEYYSLKEAFDTGQLTKWGIGKEDLKKFYLKRKPNTEDSAERQSFEGLLGS